MRNYSKLICYVVFGLCFSMQVSSATIGIKDGAISEIIGVDAKNCLGVDGSSSASGALLKSQKCANSNFQKWKFQKDSADLYQLVNVGSGLCIDVTGGSTGNGTNIQQWNCSGAKYQQWSLIDQGTGRFTIISNYNGLALDVASASKIDGANIQQWPTSGRDNQKWTAPSATPPAVINLTNGNIVTLKNASHGNCIGIENSSSAAGTKIRSQACNGSTFQQWKVTAGTSGEYQFANMGSGLCMDLPSASTVSGTEIQQWSCGTGAWQKWVFNDDKFGHYYITSLSSGLALDADSSSAVGAITQAAYSKVTQAWTVVTNTNSGSGSSSSSSTGSTDTNTPVGFGAGTTGGKGGAVVTVTKPQDLAAALCSSSAGGVCSDTTPRIIKISGILDFRGLEGNAAREGCYLTANNCSSPSGKKMRMLNGQGACNTSDNSIAKFSVTFDAAGDKPLLVGSNKTVIGTGSGSGIKGKGLVLRSGVSNIIIRNLSITDINDGIVWGGDAITMANVNKVWIDHNYTARIGRQHIVAGQDPVKEVTISNNYFDGTTQYGYFCNDRHHYIALLIAENETITVSGNRFHNSTGRSPEVGPPYLGRTPANGGIVHLVNNYYDGNYWSGGLNNASNDAAVLVEGNYFAHGLDFHPVFDTTDNKTDTHSKLNFAPVDSNIAVANNNCLAKIGRKCSVNIDKENLDTFLINPAAMTKIESFGTAAVQAFKSVVPVDASTVPNRAFGPQANIVP